MKGFFRFGSPVIKLLVERKNIEMLLDTGFNGHIMLPYGIIDELGLDQIGISDYLTASGENTITKVYRCTVLFLGKEVEVPIVGTDIYFSLAGMELFNECRIIIEKSNDIVEVKRLS